MMNPSDEAEIRRIAKEEAEKLGPKKVERTEEHNLQHARDMWSVVETAKLHGVGLAQSVSTEFVRLEVQIAALLFAVVGLFLKAFPVEHPLTTIEAKFALTIALLALIVSLIMGLLHLKCEEKFSDMFTKQRIKRSNKWREAAEGTVSFTEAKAFFEGSAIGTDGLSSPKWPWVLQTIFLGIGIVLLFALLTVFVFSNGGSTMEVLSGS